MRTDIFMVVDRSGSMGAKQSATVEGMNQFIAEQQAGTGEGDECNLTLIMFDHEYIVAQENRPIAEVPVLTYEDYTPRGGTAYRDALGRAILSAGKSPAGEDRFANLAIGDEFKVILLIITDGQDNRSREISPAQLRAMITERRELGWEIIFMGADESAIQDAVVNLGIRRSAVVFFGNDSKGVSSAFAGASRGISSYRISDHTLEVSRGATVSVDPDAEVPGAQSSE